MTGTRIRLWLATLAAWTALAVVSAVQAVRLTAGGEAPVSLATALGWQLPQWWAWAALTPAIVAADRWARGRRRPVRSAILTHLGAGCLAILLHTVVVLWADRVFFPDQVTVAGLVPGIVDHLAYRAQFEILTYAGIVGAWYAIDFFRRSQREALAASRLEAELARAELQALEMQLQPHFLFNALQAIEVLNRADPAAASRSLVRLGDLYRHVLATRGRELVPLEEEVAFLEGYLEIERLRFQDRLEVRLAIDPATRGALVPNLLLQPLVENAARHGLAPRPGPVAIEVRAEREDGRLRVEVLDDGVGLGGTDPAAAGGLGLDLVRSRLEHHYGRAASLEVAERPAGGVRARIDLPFREAR